MFCLQNEAWLSFSHLKVGIARVDESARCHHIPCTQFSLQCLIWTCTATFDLEFVCSLLFEYILPCLECYLFSAVSALLKYVELACLWFHFNLVISVGAN